MERHAIWLSCAALLLGAGGAAHAQVDYRLSAGLAALASDNPGSQAAGAAPQRDISAAVLANVNLGYLGRFATERLSYDFLATKWIGGTQRLSMTHMLRLSSEIEATPATRVGLSAGAMLSQLALADTVSAASVPTAGPQTSGPEGPNPQDSSSQQVGPQPAGNQTFLTLDARQSFSWQPNSHWRFSQGLMGRAFRSIGSGTNSVDSKSFMLDLGTSLLLQADSIGLGGMVGAMTTPRSPGGAQSSTNGQAGASLDWGHQWNLEIMHQLSAGVTVVHSETTRVLPTAFATGSWQRSGFTVAARLGQTVSNSVMVGRPLQSRMVTLSVGLPLFIETMRLLASATAEQASVVGASAGSGGTSNILSAQAGLGWQPGTVFSYGLAYTFRDQWSSDSGDNPSAVSSFRRQTVMLSISAGYGGMF